jgi:hypothetical protein
MQLREADTDDVKDEEFDTYPFKDALTRLW